MTPPRTRRYSLAVAALAATASLAAATIPAHAARPSTLHTPLRAQAVAAYDFGHPDPADPGRERDIGRSGTALSLINGGSAMRVADEAYPGSSPAMQVRQQNPATAGNDDWKAGAWDAEGMSSLDAFRSARGATVMGWFKMTGDNPALNSNTADPSDHYNAIGLAGVLSGTSDGHAVRALLELIQVNGELKLVALGRRLDSGASQTFAADAPWEELLPAANGSTWPRRSTSATAPLPSTATASPWTASTSRRATPGNWPPRRRPTAPRPPILAASRSAAASPRTPGRTTPATAAWTTSCS